jgi:hypothetical protein
MGMKRVLSDFEQEIYALFSEGPSSLADVFLNRKRSWSLSKRDFTEMGSQGSLSDSSPYLSIVERAVKDDTIFDKFKSNVQYRQILEHVSRKYGRKYWEVIQKHKTQNPRMLAFLSTDFCSPFRYTYRGLGRVSSTNLRYIKISCDLESLFGSSENFDIVELGIGYGGQIASISEMNGFRSYVPVDLPLVLELFHKYIGNFYPEILEKVKNNTDNIDLLISNYAFSELSREVQNQYLSDFVLRSKRGYVIFNKIIDDKFDTMTSEEFMNRVPGAVEIREYPQTFVGNTLIVWGYSTLENIAQ